MKNGSVICKLACVLVTVGALNWGLIAINPEWNVVNMLLGSWPVVERVVYGLVGLAGVWKVIGMFACKDCESCEKK